MRRRISNGLKRKYAQEVMSGADLQDVARKAGVQTWVVSQWIVYERAGMYEGREHLTNIGWRKSLSKKKMTPKRVEKIVSEYVNSPEPVMYSQAKPMTINAAAIDNSIIADLTRRVAMLEKVVLR